MKLSVIPPRGYNRLFHCESQDGSLAGWRACKKQFGRIVARLKYVFGDRDTARPPAGLANTDTHTGEGGTSKLPGARALLTRHPLDMFGDRTVK